jgi:recombinational DNA repair ATPase RecF
MIKLEAAHVEEVRGIRRLDIEFDGSTFAISGPNGSGKSGVIDAIEFGLTGGIGRLAGRGTRGLSVTQHGPHVDMVDFPDAAYVELKVFIPSLNKRATITRKVSAPGKPKITPDDADVKAVLAELAEHPEVTLARRDILRFILVEPSKRSEEIQTILKLEEIGQTRAALNSAQNKLSSTLKQATDQVATSRRTLQRHLGIETNAIPDLLASVNKRRAVLGLASIDDLGPETKLDVGIADPGKAPPFNRTSALRDLASLDEASVSIAALVATDAAAILAGIARLERDPALLSSLQRRVLLEKGLSLVDGPECPLCDHPWPDEEHLLGHLRAKMTKSQAAGTLQETLLRHGAAIASQVDGLLALLRQAHRISKAENANAALEAIGAWGKELGALKAQLGGFDGLIGLKDRLAGDWHAVPQALADKLSDLRRLIEAKPDQSAAVDAQTFLSTAQLRLEDYRAALRAEAAAKLSSATAKIAYEEYTRAMEDELNALYADIQADFSAFYRLVNGEDEATFTAELKPSDSRVDLKVNFYDRGLYSPAAYHSEGHQDGMGVCLYLALMKRLFGKDFTIALLDDVVMSVDSDHRRQFCKLLKTEFPDTQFIITTHDRLWAQQMRSEGLVSAKTSLVFYGWSVDTGPLVETGEDVWDDISAALAKGKVEVAAATLRRHLEYVAWVLADELSARTPFHADGKYEFGELMPAVLSRSKELYGKAADAAQSWGNEAAKAAVAERKAALSAASQASNVEQWAVNPLVHFNAWANFGTKEFEPVVAAFKDLTGTLRCPNCGSWVHATPRFAPETLRCECMAINFNLKVRGK